MPIWKPSEERIKGSEIHSFLSFTNKKKNLSLENYHELHHYSVEKNGEFWASLFEYFDLNYTGNLEPFNTDNSFI